MRFTVRTRAYLAAAGASLLLAALACNLIPAAGSKPTVVITFPRPGHNAVEGQEIVVESVSAVADEKGITRIELWADGQLVHSLAVDPPAAAYTASQPWTPAVVGTHVLEIRAYNTDDVSSDPAQVTVAVGEGLAQATLIGEGTPPAPPEPLEDTPTPFANGTIPLTPTPSDPTVDQVAAGAMVTAQAGLNVRSGPGVEYPPIGGLAEGRSAQIAGKNLEGTWWQIVYPPNSGGRGWVSAKPQYSTAHNVETVPVVPVPPPPTPTPTPLPTSTPVPSVTPTHTAVPRRPTVYSFTADRYTIHLGQSVVLRWDLADAEFAYLRYGDAKEGIVAPGNKMVNPSSTTTYTLVAGNAAGETTAQLVITVIPLAGPVVVLDFLTAAPLATWSNGSDILPWSGSDVDPRGFASWHDDALLEDGSQVSRVLGSYPEWVASGRIVGDFGLPRPIQAGDRFRTRVGFLQGSGGSVKFIVAAMGGTLSSVPVVVAVDDTGSDGLLRTIDADLGPVAGGTIIRLMVEAGPSGGQNQAVWANPRIEH